MIAKTPSHGGNRGSNPLRDAIRFNGLALGGIGMSNPMSTITFDSLTWRYSPWANLHPLSGETYLADHAARRVMEA